jgi:hypothetical protein
METKLEELKTRYLDAAHAMQTGVALMMQYDQGSTAPKHLRVGINSAMCDSAALASLLMRKKIITEEEYYQSLVDSMEAEVERYKQLLQKENPGVEFNLI